MIFEWEKMMEKKVLQYFDILEAKIAYLNGSNITEMLRLQRNVTFNTPEIIEIAYDLQAGSYIDYTEKNKDRLNQYTAELADILNKYVDSNKTLLDIGTGEMTTLSLLCEKLKNKPKSIFAFDVSWSRIYKGLIFSEKTLKLDFNRVIPFVAEMSEIPLLDKSIDITTSSHALEPNGTRLKELLIELFRVTRNKLILFEPCYEINSEEGKSRMDRLGYIKNMDGTVKELGGEVIEKIVIKNVSNPLNPTVCYVINPPQIDIKQTDLESCLFSIPGTNIPLQKNDDCYLSNKTGLCYPLLKNIPVLKSNSAVLATALCE